MADVSDWQSIIVHGKIFKPKIGPNQETFGWISTSKTAIDLSNERQYGCLRFPLPLDRNRLELGRLHHAFSRKTKSSEVAPFSG